MKKLFTLAFAVSTLTVAAQQADDDNWWGQGRPQHVHTTDSVTSGIHHAPHRVGSTASAPLRCRGEQKVPVVLVSFADRPFYAAGQSDSAVVESYNLFFNGEDDSEVYTRTHSSGSIRSYFIAQSDSAFRPQFGIIGPVQLPSKYAIYGRNSGNSKDTNISAFYRDALNQVMRTQNVDWNLYDNDGNGTVDMVFFVHAGWGENTVQTDTSAIWAKESTSGISIKAEDGSSVRFGCYAVCAEARVRNSERLAKDIEEGTYGPTGYNPDNLRMDGIGVCVHELSHALGLPDFYDTNGVAFGMDLWSVMDYGEYGNNGYTPGGYTAYERDFMGWQSLETLNGPCKLTIPCYAEGGHGYKIVNEANPNEYYIIENRQPAGWDAKVCTKGRGLQVTHVDYNASRWNGNTVNTDAAHQRMTIIAANNDYRGTTSVTSMEEWYEALEGHLFPFTGEYQDLTDETTPASVVYAGGYMGKPLRGITQNEDGTITLYYCALGELETPGMLEANEVDEELDDTAYAVYEFSWADVDDTSEYEMEVYLNDSESCSSSLVMGNRCRKLLPAGSKVKWRVRANCRLVGGSYGYLPSEWSDYQYFETLPDLIPNTPDSEKPVSIYTMGGVLVSRCMASDIHRLMLRHGVYVIRYSNGASRKVLLD